MAAPTGLGCPPVGLNSDMLCEFRIIGGRVPYDSIQIVDDLLLDIVSTQ